MTETQVDAITGATPYNGKLTYIWDGTDQNGIQVPKGKLTYIWDGTDQNGIQVPKGKYHFFIEGTLY